VAVGRPAAALVPTSPDHTAAWDTIAKMTPRPAHRLLLALLAAACCLPALAPPAAAQGPGEVAGRRLLDLERRLLAEDVAALREARAAEAEAGLLLDYLIAALDAAVAARAKTWSKKTIVTFHGSMSYYAARYGLRIAAVVEPLAGKEPTPQYVALVLAAIERGQAAALFSEPQLDKQPAEVIAREGKIPLGELDPVGGGPGRDSYEALLTWNTDQLDKVLK
jgi:zinc transport system substrate-binding protein